MAASCGAACDAAAVAAAAVLVERAAYQAGSHNGTAAVASRAELPVVASPEPSPAGQTSWAFVEALFPDLEDERAGLAAKPSGVWMFSGACFEVLVAGEGALQLALGKAVCVALGRLVVQELDRVR